MADIASSARARPILSPLNFQGLIATLGKDAPKTAGVKLTLEWVLAYRCPECSDLYDNEDEALECCDTFGLAHDQDAAADCPVCQQVYSDHREASDCCLWRDLDSAPAGAWQMQLRLAAIGPNSLRLERDPAHPTSLRNKRIHTLNRRAEHLQQRIEASTTKDLTYDRAELEALRWAVGELSSKEAQ